MPQCPVAGNTTWPYGQSINVVPTRDQKFPDLFTLDLEWPNSVMVTQLWDWAVLWGWLCLPTIGARLEGISSSVSLLMLTSHSKLSIEQKEWFLLVNCHNQGFQWYHRVSAAEPLFTNALSTMPFWLLYIKVMPKYNAQLLFLFYVWHTLLQICKPLTFLSNFFCCCFSHRSTFFNLAFSISCSEP